MARSTHWLAGALLLGACQGDIMDTPSDEPIVSDDIASYCDGRARTPGRVTIHRLNAAEYDRTMRDVMLLAPDATPSDTLPVDDESTAGFLNDADILNTSPLHITKYSSVARDLAEEAVARPAFMTRYLPCGDATCLDEFVAEFGLRAWRRPLTSEESARIQDVIAVGMEGGTLSEGLQLGIRAMLLSPNTVYRSETHDGGLRELDSYEIASRLSFFLWGAPPDDVLYEEAAANNLNTVSSLRSQIARMIDDERFAGFFEGFLHRWLKTGTLDSHVVDEVSFPEWDQELIDAMKLETELFVAEVIRDDLPMSALLNADFTYVNERLANHYGIEGVTGPEMRRVEGARGGILTQGSLLSVTSHPRVTSPVKRGEYVLHQLLCSPPPAAPADVTPEAEPVAGQSRREALEQHRADPSCAACHSQMDPIGFALENFDPIGRWRDTEDGTPDGFVVDASGVLPDGTPIDGVESLAAAMTSDERFAGCVTEKLLAYSIGRSLSLEDECQVLDILEAADARGRSLRSVIEEMVLSDVFRRVGGREEASP